MSQVLVEERMFEELFQEDLGSKMPVLLQQFPEFDEDFIRVAASADPTGDRADYITWLLRMLRAGKWEITEAGDMRDLLAEYDRQKQLVDFRDQRDINGLKGVEELHAIVQRNRELQSRAVQRREQGVFGAKKLNSVGSYSLWAVTSAEAATKFGRGKGGLHHPSTVWCTKSPTHALDYLQNGPLYTVVKEGDSYVQFHFGRKEAKDARNIPLKASQGKEIGPVCAILDPLFVDNGYQYRPPGWVLSDEDIERHLEHRMHNKFIAQRVHGFWKEGVWHDPVTDKAALELRWQAAKSVFKQTLEQARATNDLELIKIAGHRVPEPSNLQAIYNGVYEFNHAQPT